MKTSGYSSFIFNTHGLDPEIWIALLTQWPFDSFHEEGETVTAYIPTASIDDDLLEFIREHEGNLFISFEINEVPYVNWNETWEKSFQPVIVDKTFYVRAEFHSPGVPDEYLHEIIIAPKMAFGTGHHATTFMMLQAIHELDCNKKKVLDFGCGTGILAVAAALEGASSVLGIDIQPEAIENSVEHADLNRVNDICHFEEGDIKAIPDSRYSIILANITTPVILESMPRFMEVLDSGGYLLLSGILTERRDSIAEALAENKLKIVDERSKDGWVQITALKD